MEDEWTHAPRIMISRILITASVSFPSQFFFPSVSLFGEIRTGAWCNSTASCPFPRPQGASLAMCLLRQIGGGASAVEIPCKDL